MTKAANEIFYVRPGQVYQSTVGNGLGWFRKKAEKPGIVINTLDESVFVTVDEMQRLLREGKRGYHISGKA